MDRGAEPGRVVVFSHAVGQDRRAFDGLVGVVRELGWRAVTWNLPGHGGERAEAGLSLRSLAERLLAVLDEEARGQPAVLVGHSLGGYVSQAAAALRPEQVVGVVVVGATDLAARSPVLRGWLLRRSPALLRVLPSGITRRALGARSSRSAHVRRYLRAAAGRADIPTLVSCWNAMTAAVGHARRDAVRCPVLVVRGEHDDVGIIGGAAPAWGRRAPNTAYREIPGTGHHCHLEDPERFAAVLTEHLRTISLRLPP